MPIIYSLVTQGTAVLCEHTHDNHQGNFSEIARKIISRITSHYITFVNYSLEDGSKQLETRVPSRNGLRLAGISPDGGKLYLAGRGHELVIYDGNHQYIQTVELDGELEGWLYRVWQ